MGTPIPPTFHITYLIYLTIQNASTTISYIYLYGYFFLVSTTNSAFDTFSHSHTYKTLEREKIKKHYSFTMEKISI